MYRLNVKLLCLLSLTFVGSAFGQSADEPSDSSGVATYDSYSGGATFGAGTYFNLRYMSGNGVGYHGGYTSIGGVVPIWMGDNAFVGPDVRLNLGNNSQVGGNLGGIARYYSPKMDRIFGAAAYYDLDQSANDNSYHGATIGVETLGNIWDLRANAYFAPGTQDNFVAGGIPLCVTGNPFFSGNNIMFQGTQAITREQAMNGFDAEFGIPFPSMPWLRGYAGFYYYHADQVAGPVVDASVPHQADNSPLGFRTRLDAWISDDLLLGINFTTDPVWGDNLNAVVDFRFSGFKPTRYFPQWKTRERMLAPWQRNWRIAVEEYGSTLGDQQVTALNPATGRPYFVSFIDNSNTMGGGGDGTFQNPYHSFNHPGGISNADIIIVKEGDSSADNPYLGTLKLFNNQRLLGEGAVTAPLPLTATYGNCTINGTFNLPSLGSGTNHPFVQSDTGLPPVIIANNNEIAGFTIVNQDGVVIGGDPENIYIHDTTLIGGNNPNSAAISIFNLYGNNNRIENVNVFTTGGVGNNAGGGIYLASGVQGATLTMKNVFMNSAPPYGTGAQQPFGIWLNAPAPGPEPTGGGTFNVTMNNVHTNGNVAGIRLTETGQTMNVNMINVTANNNSGQGIQVLGTGGQINLTATTIGSPLLATGNGGNSLNVAMSGGGNFTGNFTNANFSGSTGGSGIAINQNGGTATLNLNNTAINNNTVDGLTLNASNNGKINVTGMAVGLSGNDRDGINITGTGTSMITTNLSGNTLINSSGRDGVFFNLTGSSTYQGTFTTGSINSSGVSAIYGTMNSSTASVILNNVLATNSVQDGFYLNANNGSTFTATLQNNSSISNGGADGIDVTLAGISTANFNLNNAHVDTNLQNGVRVATSNQSIFNLTPVNSTFNNNMIDGINGIALTNGAVNITSSANSSISNNARNGVFVSTGTGGNFHGSFANTAINTNTAGNGIRLLLSNAPSSTLSMTGTSSLNSNGANGLLVDTNTGTIFTPTLNGTSIQGNALDGVKLMASTGARIGTGGTPGTFTNALIRNNSSDGVEAIINGVGSSSNLSFVNTQITNTAGKTPQQTGFLYNVTGGGQLTAAFTGGTTLANHNLNAINGNVVGTGAAGSSSATVTLTGVNAGGNNQNNALLAVSNGGLATVNATNSSFSNSVFGSGMLASVSGVNSKANLDLHNNTFSGNAGVGFGGMVTAPAPGGGQQGASLNVCLDGSTLSNNALQGISILTDGAGATASFGVGQLNVPGSAANVNNNGREGVLANAQNGGTINFREVGSHFDGNGTAMQSDGLNFGGNNGHINTLFFGGTANNNSGNGLRLGGIGGVNTFNSDLTVSMGNGFTASGNTLFGFSLDGTGANSANLIQDPNTAPVVFTGNGSGAQNLNFANSNQVLLQLLGSFNNSAGDGVQNLTFNNINTAIVSINGLGNGTINNNAGHGIFVQMVDVSNAAVAISGYQSISNNGKDGIHIEMTGINKTINGAIEIAGVNGKTVMAGNKENGVNIQLTKTNLVDPFNSLPGVNLTVLTTTDNVASFNCIPQPVVLAAGSNGVIPSNALRINNLNVTGSGMNGGNGGVQLTGLNSSIVQNNGFITNNIVNGSLNGGGIGVNLTNTAAPTAAAILDNLIISGNTVQNNMGDGIAVTLTNGAPNVNLIARNLQITNNNVRNNTGVGILDTVLNNNVAQVVNTQGTNISDNTVWFNGGGGILHSITNVQASTTFADSTRINNNSVQNNTGFGIMHSINNKAGKATSVSSLQIANNLVAANTGARGILSTLAGGSTFTSNNDAFIANTLRNNGTDGLVLDWQNTNAAGVNFTGVSSTLHSAGNGMKLNLVNSVLSAVNLTNATLSNNSGGNGLLATLNGSSITGVNATNFKADDNKLNGLSVVDLNGSAFNGATFTGSSFQRNGSDGVNLIANDLTQSSFGTNAAPIIFNSTTIANNGKIAAGNGVRVRLFGNSTGNLQFVNGTLIGNTAGVTQQHGLDFVLGASGTSGGVLTTLINSSTISNNSIDGVVGVINGTGTGGQSVANMTVTNNSRIQNNTGRGMGFTINKSGGVNLSVVNNSQITGNGGDGVFVAATDTTTGNNLNAIINSSIIRNNGASGTGNGVTVNLDNNARATMTITNATIGNSAPGGTQQRGLNLNLNQSTVGSLTNLTATVTNTTLSNNNISGIVTKVKGTLAGPTLIPPTVPANVAGAHLVLNDVQIANSGGNGMSFLISGNTPVTGGFLELNTLNGTSVTGSAQNGVLMDVTGQRSLASVKLLDSQFNDNGTIMFPGDGFNATASGGAIINIGAETTIGSSTVMSFSGNTGDGLDVIASGNLTRVDVDLHEVIAGADAGNGLTGNELNGVTTQVFDGGVTNLRANTTHFDGNFGAGLFGYVKDANGLNTTGRFNIIGGSADNNLGDGYSLLAENTTAGPNGVATLTAQFQSDDGGNGISAQGNGGFGLNFVASNPPMPAPAGGIVGNLLMTGGSTLLNNGAGTLNVNMDGADQAIIGLSGTFNGSTTGDGIHINLSNITGLALVSLQGPGEVRDNAGDGIDVTLNNVALGGVFIGGFTDVSANGFGNNIVTGQDGIKVTMTNVGLGALKIDAQTQLLPANIMNVSSNHGNGVNVLIDGGSVIDNVSFDNALALNQVDVIAYTPPEQPLPTPLPNPLLTITQVNPSTALGFSFLPGLAIQNLIVDGNGVATAGNLSGDGIVFTASGVGTQIIDTPLITNNTITNTGLGSSTTTHDGIVAQVLAGADVTAIDLLVNDVESNNGNGIVFNANNAPTFATLNINENTVLNNTGGLGTSGNGIVVNLTSASALSNINVDLNDVEGNSGDGFQMLNPNTGVTNLAVNFTHNMFINNGSIVPPSASTTYPAGGMGIDIVLNNLNTTTTTVNVLSDANGINTVSSNASFGLFLQATNSALYNLNVTGTGARNVFDQNTDAGIAIVGGSFVNPNSSLDPTKFSVGNVVIDNVNITNTLAGSHPSLPNYPFSGDGIGVLLQQYAQMNSFVIGSGIADTRNTTLASNAGDGLRINAIEQSQFRHTQIDGTTAITTLGQATILLQQIDATGNGRNGINIIRRDNAVLSWDDETVNAGAALFVLNNELSWQAITDQGSFVHINDVISTQNELNGLNISTTNAQFPITRVDIVDTNPVVMTYNPKTVGHSVYDSNNTRGMQFTASADSILVVNARDTSASDNLQGGIRVQTFNRATFGDVLTATPLGDPTSDNSIRSTFNGMLISGNGRSNTNANAHGFEVLANGTTDPGNISSLSVVNISMTQSATNARNTFDSNGGDAFRITTARFSDSYFNLNRIDMRDTAFVQLGSDGLHVTTTEASSARVDLTNALIGYPTASSTQTGLSGDGIDVLTTGGSFLALNVGNTQTLNRFGDGIAANLADPVNAPDVSIYGNRLNGIVVRNQSSSAFISTMFDTASRFNGNRGYSGELQDSSTSLHQIDRSLFSDNSFEGIAIIANSRSQSGISSDVASLATTQPAFGNAYLLYNWLNLNPTTEGAFVLTNSRVENNGSASPYVNSTQNVNGLEIDVSTRAYVAADIRNNIFGGNTLDDVATASFTATSGGFNANGTISNVGVLNTPGSIDEVQAGIDRIFWEDTAQLDMRFMHNTGDRISVSSGGSNNPNMGAGGARRTDPNTKFQPNSQQQTALFQVNAFHYDTVNTVTSDNVFTGTNIAALDANTGATVQDAVNFPGATTVALNGAPPPTTLTTIGIRNIEAGFVNQADFYTNSHAFPNNPTTAFTQVRLDNVSTGVNGTNANGVIGYTAGGQFTLNGTGSVGISNGDVIRVHLLDTNTFNQFGTPQNVEGAFNSGFGTGHPVRVGPGQNANGTGTFFDTNNLAPYFQWPSSSFPPN